MDREETSCGRDGSCRASRPPGSPGEHTRPELHEPLDVDVAFFFFEFKGPSLFNAVPE